MVAEPIRRSAMGMTPKLAEPSVTEHLFLLAGGYKRPDGTVDREAFSAAMEKNEWLKSKTKLESADTVKGRIETACWQVESGRLSEGQSWVLSLNPN